MALTKEQFDYLVDANAEYLANMNTDLISTKADFTGLTLQSLKIKGRILKEASFENSDIRDCDFISIDFSNCNFHGVRLVNCKFFNCNFNGSKFWHASINDSMFVNCMFDNGYIEYTVFSGNSTRFMRCTFHHTSVCKNVCIDDNYMYVEYSSVIGTIFDDNRFDNIYIESIEYRKGWTTSSKKVIRREHNNMKILNSANIMCCIVFSSYYNK